MPDLPILIDHVGPLMQTVLTCVNEALTAGERPVGLASLTPGGLPAWDNCCDAGGQLYVRLVSQFPSTGPGAPFPAFDSQQSCGVQELAVQIGVGVIRCVTALTDAGRAPSGDTMTQETLGMTADAALVLQALRCCLPDALRVKVGQWTPQGAQGGCAGGEWAVTIGAAVCECPG